MTIFKQPGTVSAFKQGSALPRILGRAIPCLLLTAHLACAAKFCIAPDGSDSNPGTKERPFASIQRAQKAVSPGDTVYIRGGTYRMKESDIASRDSFLASIFLLDKSGTRGKPIQYFNYPGETPVFECSDVKPAGLRISAFRVRASWIHLKGLEVTGVQVTATGHTQSICFENFGDHNIYENLSMHDGQAIGLFITRGSDNLVLNCDAYRNHDHTSEGGRGGNTDGFGCHVPRRGANNVFKGCRAWLNSDDGFDCISQGDAVTFINCWAMYNGFSPDRKKRGDGTGFKAGGYGVESNTRFPNPVPRNRVIRCLAVGNRNSGFYANHHPGGIDWIQNSAYQNGINYNFLGRNAEGTADIPGQGHKIVNNLSYGTTRHIRNLDAARSECSGNSFDLNYQFSDKDFISLDEAALTAPRKPNGDLPDIRFLYPTKGNPLRESGAQTGTEPETKTPEVGVLEKS
jgi:Domain of unknown function/Right handed beta helix region